MNKRMMTAIHIVAFLLLAFVSGIAASSFYIGDRNLLVSVAATALVGASLYSTLHKFAWIKTLTIITGLVAGFICSIIGIC